MKLTLSVAQQLQPALGVCFAIESAQQFAEFLLPPISRTIQYPTQEGGIVQMRLQPRFRVGQIDVKPLKSPLALRLLAMEVSRICLLEQLFQGLELGGPQRQATAIESDELFEHKVSAEEEAVWGKCFMKTFGQSPTKLSFC
jgi:hypothetical protein